MKKLLLVLSTFLLMYAVQAQVTPTKTKTKQATHQMKDRVTMENGKMMVTKDGKTSEMMEDMTLKSGTMIMKDGTVKMKDGKTVTLQDGDYVTMNGAVVHKMKTKTKMRKM